MPSILVAKQYEQELEPRLDYLSQIEPQTLTRPDLGTELNFLPAKPIFERLQGIATRLKGIGFSTFPVDHLHRLAELSKRLKESVAAIQSYTIPSSNPQEQRQKVLANLSDQEGQFFSTATPLLLYAELTTGALNAVRAAADQAVSDIKLRVSEADKALEAARSISAHTAVEAYARFFSEEASRFRTASRGWMLATILLGFTTAALAAWGIWKVNDYAELSTSSSVQLAVGKLLLFSVLYFALVWCGRVFKANKHNEVVSRHRETALRSFAAFVSAAGDDAQVKNAVLLHTCQSIFAPQATGFVSSEAEPAGPQIVEFIRSFGETKEKS